MKRWLIAAALLAAALPAFAGWQSRDSNYNQNIVTGGVTFDLSFVTFATDTTDATTYTFSSQSFGVADTNRVIAVSIGTRVNNGGTNQVSSVTIGGISATLAIRSAAAGTGFGLSEIWYASVPTGTTGTVVVNTATTAARCIIGIYRIITTTPAPTNTASNSVSNSASPFSLNATLTVPTGGAGIGIGFDRFGGVGADWTWTNATEDFEVDQLEGFSDASGARVTSTGAISVTLQGGTSAGNNDITLALASWGP